MKSALMLEAFNKRAITTSLLNTDNKAPRRRTVGKTKSQR